jgi:predicted GNAT family acetyltransferase
MIRKLTIEDKDQLMRFLNKEPEYNLYIIGDVNNFGFDGAYASVYGEFRDGELFSVLSQNYLHLVYYAKAKGFNKEWLSVMEKFEFYFLSGKAELVREIHPYFPDMWDDKLDFAKSTTFTEEEGLSYEYVNILTSREEALKVYDLLSKIEELDTVGMKTRQEFADYLLRHSGENGTTAYITEDEKVVASASAVFESEYSAMIVGVGTDKNYRGKGYGKKVMHYLMNLYINEKKKTLCLYYDDPRAEALYQKLGFIDVGDWIMLIKEDNND